MADKNEKQNSFLMNLSDMAKRWGKKPMNEISDEAKKLSIELQNNLESENEQYDNPEMLELTIDPSLKLDQSPLIINSENDLNKAIKEVSTGKKVDDDNQIKKENKLEKSSEISEKIIIDQARLKLKNEENQNVKEKPLPVECNVFLKISSDNLQAYINIKAPQNGGADVSIDLIRKKLNDYGIVYGIDTKQMIEIVAGKKYDEDFVIAKGLLAIDGKDGYLEQVVEISDGLNMPKIREDGTMDYKELDTVSNVEKGQLICRIFPPLAGTPGKNVLGAEIAQQVGKEVPSPDGRNTAISEDGTMLVATSNGCVSFISHKYNVSEVYKINGNVDTTTGNINFLGSVIITGDVKEGFSVTATDQIKISGMVEGAYIRSGASVTVKNGVNGMGKGVIIANGDVKCKFIENCRIQAYCDVYAETIINADIKCDGEIISTTGKGVIMGGQYVVAKGVNAKIIGSQSNMNTQFTLGVTVTLNDKIAQARSDYEKLMAEIQNLAKVANYLAEVAKRNQLTSEKLALYNNAVYSHNVKLKELEQKQSEIVVLEAQLNNKNNSVLQAKNCIYPGVTVVIGNSSYRVKNQLVKPMIYLGEEGIIASEGASK